MQFYYLTDLLYKNLNIYEFIINFSQDYNHFNKKGFWGFGELI